MVENDPYISEVAQDSLMREAVELRLFDTINACKSWPAIGYLSVWYISNRGKPGSPGKITTGLRDLLLIMEMHRAAQTGVGTKRAATELADYFHELGLWPDRGETLRRHYMRLCREGPTMSIGRAAYGLYRLRFRG